MSPKVPKYWNSVKGDILNSMAAMSFESYSWGEIEQIDMYGLNHMLPISEPEIKSQCARELT